MGKEDREREVKFYLSDPQGFETRLAAAGARIVSGRVHEINLRFDTPQGDLRRDLRVLRLRQDTQARLTYKGPSETEAGVRSRQEIEFTVGDFASARALFEVLGYQVHMIYEKYRTTYELGLVEITLDEMPFGPFAEVEGPDGVTIRTIADRLELNWEARILESYLELFDRTCNSLGLAFRDLTFENFRDVNVPPPALGVRHADAQAM